MSIIDNNDTEMLSGMDTMQALSLFSDTECKYRIIWECGGAEAAERQRRSGVGSVTSEGYVRTVPHEYFANLAREDPQAVVEEV
jgi:hypothetical protein